MKQSLQLKLGQHLTMTPQLQQAIRLLQLSTLDLQQEIQEALDSNPLLELVESTPADDAVPGMASSQQELPEETPGSAENEAAEPDTVDDVAAESIPADLAVDTSWDDIYETGGAGPGGSGDEPQDFEQYTAEASTLSDHLLWQLNLTPMSETDRMIALAVIDAIDADGMLSVSVEDIAEGFAPESGVETDEIVAVLHRIQHFDPVGVGARDLRECLLIQLRQLKEQDSLAAQIVAEHLSLVEAKRFDKLAKELKVRLEQVAEAVKLISSLEPKPGRNYSTTETRYVTPDVFVHKMDGEYQVSLNDDGLPRLRVSNSYRRLLADAEGAADAKSYIREKLSAAQWLIRSIHQRQSTLYKVTNSIVRFQSEFLDHGVKALRPLVLKDVANDIGMHESTVSRATANKYVHTPQGTLELKYFFTSSIRSTDGEGVSAESVKEKIKGIIESEDPRRPYSDQHIAQALASEHIEIARRTVAKYREIMGILPSSRRRQMA